MTGWIFPHNIDALEKSWEAENASYSTTHTLNEIVTTKNSQFKEHCIIKTSSMYNCGDKGGNNNTNHSANMVSEQVTAQMTALEERNDHLKDNQYKLNDALAQLVCGDTTIGGESGIPPVIDTKSMGTALTESNTDCSSLMAQQNTQMQTMQTMIQKLSEKVVAGGSGNCQQNPNKNTSDRSKKRAVTFYRQWNKYCHSCGVVLNGKGGCGTGSGKDCYLKKEGHKDVATFTNKMGGNTKRNHLWHLWCEPGTNYKVSALPAGAKTEN